MTTEEYGSAYMKGYVLTARLVLGRRPGDGSGGMGQGVGETWSIARCKYAYEMDKHYRVEHVSQ